MNLRQIIYYLFICLMTSHSIMGQNSVFGGALGYGGNQISQQGSAAQNFYGNQGLSANNVLSLIDYIKNKYFYKVVDVLDEDGKIVGEGRTVQFIIGGNDEYYFILDNEEKIIMVFEKGLNRVYTEAPLTIEEQRRNEQRKRLETEIMMTTTISKIGGGEASEALSIPNTALNMMSGPQYNFVSSGSLKYYDKRTKQHLRADVMVYKGGLYLEGGIPLSVKFERM